MGERDTKAAGPGGVSVPLFFGGRDGARSTAAIKTEENLKEQVAKIMRKLERRKKNEMNSLIEEIIKECDFIQLRLRVLEKAETELRNVEKNAMTVVDEWKIPICMERKIVDHLRKTLEMNSKTIEKEIFERINKLRAAVAAGLAWHKFEGKRPGRNALEARNLAMGIIEKAEKSLESLKKRRSGTNTGSGL